MKAADVKVGAVYSCTVSGKLAPVRVLAQKGKGYECINLKTNRRVTTRTAARLIRELSGDLLEVYLS